MKGRGWLNDTTYRDFPFNFMGNSAGEELSYYDRLASYIKHNELLNEEQTFELFSRIESFIEQEIEEIKQEDEDEWSSSIVWEKKNFKENPDIKLDGFKFFDIK